PRSARSPHFPYTTLFRSKQLVEQQNLAQAQGRLNEIAYTIDFNSSNPIGSWVYALVAPFPTVTEEVSAIWLQHLWQGQPKDEISDRKSTRLNSSHVKISY